MSDRETLRAMLVNAARGSGKYRMLHPHVDLPRITIYDDKPQRRKVNRRAKSQPARALSTGHRSAEQLTLL